MLSKRYESTEVDRRTWLQVPSGKHNLKTKYMKALDIIKVVAYQEWGAVKTVLLNLYRSLIRSKLDYGCIVYGSARPSYLTMLNIVHIKVFVWLLVLSEPLQKKSYMLQLASYLWNKEE